jgi:hypothetical protein
MGTTVLAISDLHLPHGHRDHLAFLTELKRKFRPTRVVCLGDEFDAHALSFHEHDPDGHSAGHELTAAIEAIQPLYKLFPEVSVCVSNHGARPFRLARHAGIPMAYMADYRTFSRAPAGWWWQQHWEVDGVRYFHGEGFSGATGHLKAALSLMQPVVIGHLHNSAGIAWAANAKHLVWGMNAGCLIDRDSFAFAYGKHLPNKPILGSGIVIDGRPQFIAMRLNRGGRWTGEL